MNIQLTPAPLFTHDDSFINKEGKRVGVVRITDSSESGGKWIGEVPPYGIETGNFPDYEEAKAYAKLFAAAPDMLSALQAALAVADKTFTGVRTDECQAVYDQVKAAIDKATRK